MVILIDGINTCPECDSSQMCFVIISKWPYLFSCIDPLSQKDGPIGPVAQLLQLDVAVHDDVGFKVKVRSSGKGRGLMIRVTLNSGVVFCRRSLRWPLRKERLQRLSDVTVGYHGYRSTSPQQTPKATPKTRKANRKWKLLRNGKELKMFIGQKMIVKQFEGKLCPLSDEYVVFDEKGR